jgi:hypothetical protein
MSPIVSIHPRSLSTCYERIEYWRSTRWQRLNEHLDNDVRSLFIVDLNNNNIDDLIRLERLPVGLGLETVSWLVSDDGRSPWRRLGGSIIVLAGAPVFAYAGRFRAAPGGGVLLIDPSRLGHFYSPAEGVAGASPSWTSLFSVLTSDVL